MGSSSSYIDYTNPNRQYSANMKITLPKPVAKAESGNESNSNCPVCLEMYDSGSHSQIKLECAHDLCRQCLYNMNLFQSMVCPLCRKQISHNIILNSGNNSTSSKKFSLEFNILAFQPNQLQIKFLVLGNTNTGKTSLIRRYCEGIFNTKYIPTLIGYANKKVINLQSKTVNLNIWEIPSEQKSELKATLTHSANTSGIILCYSVTDAGSFEDLRNWYDAVREVYTRAKIVLIGNKNDLEAERKVPEETAKFWAEAHDINFVETSAKENKNIQNAFSALLQHAILSLEFPKMVSKK